MTQTIYMVLLVSGASAIVLVALWLIATSTRGDRTSMLDHPAHDEAVSNLAQEMTDEKDAEIIRAVMDA